MSKPKPEIETLASRLVYESPWIKVREDEVRFGDGAVGIFNVVQKVDFVAIIALDDKGRACMVEQFRYGRQARAMEFPVGGCDPKYGNDPEKVARAELREEAGLTASRLVPVGKIAVNGAYMNQTLYIYLATGLETVAQSLKSGEHGLTVHTLPVSEIEQRIRDGRIVDEHAIAVFGFARLQGLI